MKKLFYLILILSFGCKNTPQEFILNTSPWLNKNENNYKVFIEEIRYKNDSIEKYNLINAFFEFKIENDNNKGFSNTFKMRPYIIKNKNNLSELELLSDDTIKYYNEFEIKYSTNNIGQFKKIDNKNEIANQIINNIKDSKLYDEVDFNLLKSHLLNNESSFNKISNYIFPYHLLNSIPKSFSMDSIYYYENSGSYLSIIDIEVINEYKTFTIVINYDDENLLNKVSEIINEANSSLNKDYSFDNHFNEILRYDTLKISTYKDNSIVLTEYISSIKADSISMTKRIVSDLKNN